mgnify:CR=1 FL=1
MRLFFIVLILNGLSGCYSANVSTGQIDLSNGFHAGVQVVAAVGELIVDEVKSSGVLNKSPDARRYRSSSVSPYKPKPYKPPKPFVKRLADNEVCAQATARSLDGTIIWSYYEASALEAVIEADQRGLDCGIGEPEFPDDLAEYYAGRDVLLPSSKWGYFTARLNFPLLASNVLWLYK